MTLAEHIANIVCSTPGGMTVGQIAARMQRTPRQIGAHVSKAADYYGLDRIPVRNPQRAGARNTLLYRARAS